MNKKFIIILVSSSIVIVFLAINPFHFDWNGIAAIATCIAAGGVGVAIWQINESRKSTNAQIAMDLFKELRSVKALRRLQDIYKREDSDPNKLNDNAKEDISYILDRFEVLGILVDKGIVDEDIAIHAYGGASALRCWYRLHNYIKVIRNERGPYKLNFEIYTRRCLEYFPQKGIEVKLTLESKIGEEKKTVDIIAELQKPEFKPRTRKEIENDRNVNRINSYP